MVFSLASILLLLISMALCEVQKPESFASSASSMDYRHLFFLPFPWPTTMTAANQVSLVFGEAFKNIESIHNGDLICSRTWHRDHVAMNGYDLGVVLVFCQAIF